MSAVNGATGPELSDSEGPSAVVDVVLWTGVVAESALEPRGDGRCCGGGAGGPCELRQAARSPARLSRTHPLQCSTTIEVQGWLQVVVVVEAWLARSHGEAFQC